MSNLDKKQLDETIEALNSMEKEAEEFRIKYKTTDLYKEGVSEDDYVHAKLWGPFGSIYGTNVSLLKVQIYELKQKEILSLEERNQLISYYNELGLDNYGRKKPKVCWNFVRNGTCSHSSIEEYNKGQVISNFWHPGIEEKKYLKNKNNKK